MKITFVMPMTTDSRMNRRLQAVLRQGHHATAFAFERASYGGALPGDGAITLKPLGFVHHGRYLARLPKLLLAVVRMIAGRRVLAQSDVLYAFGPDCLAITVLALELTRLRRPFVVYEVADVRETMSAPTRVGAVLRTIERWLLRRVDRIVVTSAKYRDNYYVKLQGRTAESTSLVENKLFPPVPPRIPRPAWDGSHPPVLGYFGLLRFQEGWDSLMAIAGAGTPPVRVYVRGYQMGLTGFEQGIARPNVEYGGSYVAPTDLAEIYARIDILWTVYDARLHRNLAWAMANRFYEALYYGVPIVACAGTYLAERVEETGVGWVVPDSSAEAAVAFMQRLTPADVDAVRARIAALPADYSIGERDLLEFFEALAAEAGGRTDRIAVPDPKVLN